MHITTRIDHHSATIFLLITSLLIIIGARLFYLQIYLNQELHNRAKKNFTRFIEIPPERGNLLDCKNRLLATNRPLLNMYWQGTGNRTLSKEQKEILETMSAITKTSYSDSLIKEVSHVEKYGKTRILIHDLAHDALIKILEKYPTSPNIVIEQQTKRFYPHNNIACHIVGYINTFAEEGIMGLEHTLEKLLHGTHGISMTTINSVGAQLNTEMLKNPLHGTHIQTTIDLDLQLIAEKIYGAEQPPGILLLMEANTGALKAVISNPRFNPNIFLQALSSEAWQELKEKKPFLNRAFNACYPPASPFKLVSLAAALELNIINPHSTVRCHGHTNFYGRAYHCARKTGHGSLTVEDAVAQSCNILFFDIAKEISIDQLADYAHRFGLGEKAHLPFPEQEGLVPSKAWKWKTKKEPWWSGETLSVVIGQGYLLATPMQIVRMISAIFTGSLIQPRILIQEPIVKNYFAIKNETRRFLKKCMKSVVTHGTGVALRSLSEKMHLYAKTGTAQVSDLTKRTLGTEHLEHGWFVCKFRYKSEEPMIFLILLEHAGSSQIAAEWTKKFLHEYQHFIDTKNNTL